MILYNPTDKDIESYRIEEVVLDENGHAVVQPDGGYQKTGKTMEWTIKAGQKLDFPDYVAKYLKYIYGFLDIIDEPKQPEPSTSVTASKGPSVSVEPTKATPSKETIPCKGCGQRFANPRALGLHVAYKHPEMIGA